MKPTEKQIKKIEEIAQKYKLKLVLLFGSQVTERVHKESDFDIAYLPEKSFDFDKEIYLNYEFTNILQNDRVDTVDLRKAHPLLMKQILDNYVVLYEKGEDIFDNFEVYALQRFAEAKPIFQMRQKAIDKFIKKYD